MRNNRVQFAAGKIIHMIYDKVTIQDGDNVIYMTHKEFKRMVDAYNEWMGKKVKYNKIQL